jgi:hypothetical protein
VCLRRRCLPAWPSSRAASLAQSTPASLALPTPHTQRALERSDKFYFSVPPSVVRSPQKQKLVAALPLDRLVLETDAPALGPERGATNRPSNITVARDEVARIKGVSPEEVARVTTANALRLFPRLTRRLGGAAGAVAGAGLAAAARGGGA